MITTFRSRLLTTTLIASTAALAAPAFAQDAAAGAPGEPASPAAGIQAPESSPNAETSSGEIVVTGTLIKDPSIVASAPVQVIGQNELQLRQTNTAEEILRTLPGAVASIGSAVNNGNAGSSYVDLRGLGNQRNIVLLDGRRIVPADLVGRVDLNDIPLALVERVDTLTGGASTTYGADAVSGVVNFITRSNFAGAELSASNQITERGDGNYFRADATIGANFDDGKGNAVFSIGYQHADPVYQSARKYSGTAIDSFSGLPAGSGTSFPSTFNIPGLGNQQILPATGALTAPYAPFNFNPYNIFQTPFKRFNIYGAGHYEIADGLEIYTRGLYSKNIVSTIVAPSGVFASNVTIPLSNPYLPAAARATFCAHNDFDPNTAGVQTITAAQCAAGAVATSPTDPNYRTFSTQLRLRTTDVGPRTDVYTTQVFDYRGGLRGSITDSLNFDVNGSYGESENSHVQGNYVGLSKVRDALLATNTTTCLSGNAGCVPLNIFGPAGSINAAQANYLREPAFNSITASLLQVSGTINGDVGIASPLASKPISFAVGGEYRKYKAAQTADTLSLDPSELGGAGGAITPFSGGYDVVEAFGEVIAPLVQDQPFFHDLTFEGGIRRSHYRIKAPTSPSFDTTTYKAGGSWQPIADVKFRGVYQHAVRAPNINELFQPNVTGLTNLATDPCASLSVKGVKDRPTPTGNLAAVCLAQGAPAFTLGTIQDPSAGQPNATSGGSLLLKPEKANTYTFGVVLQPKMVRGLTFTVDYYHIKVSGAVSTPTSDDAINACFDNLTAASATSTACTIIRRNPDTGALDGDPGTTPGLFLGLSNLGTILTDGIDVGVNYKHDVGPGVLNLSFQGNWTRRSLFQATPSSLNRECVGYYSTSCAADGGSTPGSLQPKYFWNQRTTYSIGPVDMSLLWRHISSMKQEPLDAAVEPAFGSFGRIKAFNYFDLATRIGVGDHFEFTVTVDNLLDKQPPITGYDIGTTFFNSGNTYPSTYDTLGRRFAVGGRLKF